jgi:hypothetical protein
MKSNIPIILIATLFCSIACFVFIKATNINKPVVIVPNEFGTTVEVGDNTLVKPSKNLVQVALLLDTSGSMNGLLEQAKSQLWNIVNQLADTEKQGEETNLEIALYEYGNPAKAKRPNEINLLSAFTSDMDLISEKLFQLSTNGGDEYCGTIIKTSLDELEWGSNESLKFIYIAGNEGFNQGPISYEEACIQAKQSEVVVNTIFCGNAQEGINLHWKTGAYIADGDYMNIDHNEKTVYIESPYDDEINEWNKKLNKTYIPFGKEGSEKLMNLNAQDNNAKFYGKTNMASRAKFKASKKYKADTWDLVDAYKKDKSILKKAKPTKQEHKALSIEELEAAVLLAESERDSITTNIKELSEKRKAFVKAETEKSKSGVKSDLEQSIINSVKKQAKKKGYEFKQ